jgi:hypothetical protein
MDDTEVWNHSEKINRLVKVDPYTENWDKHQNVIIWNQVDTYGTG